jgi:hypothetical protein
MAREDEYRKYAADMVEMAQRVSLSGDKGRLLAMAEAWLNLADRAQKVARRHQASGASADQGEVRPQPPGRVVLPQ